MKHGFIPKNILCFFLSLPFFCSVDILFYRHTLLLLLSDLNYFCRIYTGYCPNAGSTRWQVINKKQHLFILN